MVRSRGRWERVHCRVSRSSLGVEAVSEPWKGPSGVRVLGWGVGVIDRERTGGFIPREMLAMMLVDVLARCRDLQAGGG